MPELRGLGRVLTAPIRGIAGTWRATYRTAASLPDVVEAILVLPHLARELEVIRMQTATLPEMHAEIARVRGDTAALPHIDETLERMAVLLERVDMNTAAVERMAEVMVPLRGAALRLGRLADDGPRGLRRRPATGA